jgi:hypothetical protein
MSTDNKIKTELPNSYFILLSIKHYHLTTRKAGINIIWRKKRSKREGKEFLKKRRKVSISLL